MKEMEPVPFGVIRLFCVALSPSLRSSLTLNICHHALFNWNFYKPYMQSAIFKCSPAKSFPALISCYTFDRCRYFIMHVYPTTTAENNIFQLTG